MESNQKPKILIVDDEPSNIKILAEVLESVYKTIVATNGKDALECVKSEPIPDLILLDIIMPDMDGYIVLKELKADIKTQNIPVIFLTGLNEEMDEEYGLLLGAVDYITKPFSLATVNARIRTHIDLKRHRDNIEELIYNQAEEMSVSNKRLREEIRERKCIEEKLSLQTSALEAVDFAMLITDTDGTILWINKAFTDMTGYRTDEIIGEKPSLLKSGKQNVLFYTNLWAEISDGKTWRGKLTNRRKDGSFYNEEMTITPFSLTGDQITHYIATKYIASDMADTVCQNKEYRDMEYIFTFVNSISMDLKNVFLPIKQNIKKAVQITSKNDLLLPYLNSLDKVSNKASDLIRQILTFSKQANHKFELFNISPILDTVTNELRETSSGTINITKNYRDSIGLVLGDPDQIKKAIKTIGEFICNTETDRKRGLIIDLFSTEIGPENANEFPELEAGEYCHIRFTDSKKIMDQNEISKLFDPLIIKKTDPAYITFNTAIYDIIYAHEGAIRISSDTEKGTVYDVLFPIHAKYVSPYSSDYDESSKLVLFVDDDKSVTQTCKCILEQLNYDVIPVNSGREALDLFKSAPDSFDVVITDLIMPEMTGKQLMDGLINIRQDIPIILISGFSEMITKEHAEADGFIDYLNKPITYRKLDKSIRRAVKLKSRE